MNDSTNLRKYRIELPNLIDDLDLSVYAFRLYVHIRRKAGANGGSCYEGTRKLAETCRMSVGQVSSAKKELLDKGLITKTTRPSNGGTVDELIPVDVWQQNYDTYNKGVHTVNTLKPTTGKGVHTVNEGVQVVNTGVHTVNERKNHVRKNKEETEAPSFFVTIAEACRVDLSLCTDRQKGQIAQAVKKLTKAGKTPEEIPKVLDYWYTIDWRGKKGDAPRPDQLIEVWHPATTHEEYTNGHRNGSHIRQGTSKHSERGKLSEADLDKPL